MCRRIDTILMASLKVIVNSFKILAWQFNLLLHACDGGAALSKSSYMIKQRQSQSPVLFFFHNQKGNNRSY